MNEHECDRLFHKVLGRVGRPLSTGKMLRVALAIGVNISSIQDQTRRPPLLDAISKYYTSLNEKEKQRALRDLVRAVGRENPELVSELYKDIEGEGFMFVDGEFMRIEL